MKKTIITSAIALFLGLSSIGFAQSPNAIPYQAVARNTSGTLIANQNISLRFSIHDVTASGTVVYQETQSVTTNQLGLFAVNIGQGTAVTGNFSTINWGTGAKFTQVEIDPTGGSTYTDMGTQQMMSVPYALYAAHSNDAGPAGAQGATGATGTAGTNGTNGTNGVAGATGATGNNGTNGTNGTNGIDGTNGIVGATGATGNNGTNGTNGTNGIDGTNGTNGTNGIAGATGATGNNGTNGTNGIAGATGATGNNGTNGTNGVAGATGATGNNGTNGTNGLAGATGATGNNGTNGTNGLAGATGSTGSTGLTGATGAAGPVNTVSVKYCIVYQGIYSTSSSSSGGSFFLGQIIPFAGTFIPADMLQCNGQLLQISQYTALYSILGTTYGGNGTTNFALPNLNGKTLIGY